MASKLEKKIEKNAMLMAESAGWWQRKFTSPGHSGVPDRVLGKGNRVVFIEFKVPGEDLDPLQVVEHEAMRDCGMREVYTASSTDEVRQILGIGSSGD